MTDGPGYEGGFGLVKLDPLLLVRTPDDDIPLFKEPLKEGGAIGAFIGGLKMGTVLTGTVELERKLVDVLFELKLCA